MKNFTYYVPTKIHFGKGMISHLSELLVQAAEVECAVSGQVADFGFVVQRIVSTFW